MIYIIESSLISIIVVSYLWCDRSLYSGTHAHAHTHSHTQETGNTNSIHQVVHRKS